MKNTEKTVGMSTRGSSMVEVLVAFMIVMIAVAGFTKVVASSNDMLSKSRAAIAQTEAFDKEYYKSGITKEDVTGQIQIVVGNGKTLSLAKGNVKKFTNSGMSRYTVELDMEDGDTE